MWVFGYGSLVWNPGFNIEERVIGTLPGYERSFCMRSVHHRGTDETPGLVLALDAHRTEFCVGVGLRVAETNEADVLAYLRERELVSSAYLERVLPLDLHDGRQVEAVTYVVDAKHEQYCGGVALEEQARIIAKAVGGRGPNTEYLYNTVAHLVELGIRDPDLEWLVERVKQIAA